MFNPSNPITRLHNRREESRASVRPTGDSLKQSFFLVFLALKAPVELAACRVVKVLVAQVGKEALGPAVSHGHASILIPENGAGFRETEVANARQGVAVTSDTAFLDAQLGCRYHVGCTNERCQVLGRAADAAGSGVSNGGDTVEVGGLDGLVSLESVGAGTPSSVVVEVTDGTNGRFATIHIRLPRSGRALAVREGVASQVERVERRLKFQ